MIRNKAGIIISFNYKSGPKIGIIIFIAFTLLITIPTMKMFYDYLTKYQSTQATILSIKKEIRETYKDSEGRRKTRTTYEIEIQFFVDNKEIKKVISYSKYPIIGNKIEIRYNPQNPNQIIPMSTSDIKLGIFIIIFFWIIITIIAIIVFSRR